MSSFEYIFTLFGLLLGLALAEVLSGFSKALKARTQVRIGWLTPLLGLLVMLDLTSFWITAWDLREALPVRYWVLMLVLVHTGLYYLAATLIFPDDARAVPDHDEHYFGNKRLVLGAMLAANLPNLLLDWQRPGALLANPVAVSLTLIFFGLLLGCLIAQGRRINLALLVLMISLYPIGGVATATRDWLGAS